MRTIVILLASIVAFAPVAEAASRSKAKARVSKRKVDTGRHSDFDRLPISITRPDNARHYKFQSFPLWAARALEPRQTR